MRIFSSCGHVGPIVWLHRLDFNEILGEKVNGNYTKMLHAVLNKTWKQHFKLQLYGQLPLILLIIQERWASFARHFWKNKDKLIGDVWWTSSHGHTSVGWSAKTFSHQFCEDIWCHLEDLPRVMTSGDGWQESQGNPCCQRALMMMMVTVVEFFLFHCRLCLCLLLLLLKRQSIAKWNARRDLANSNPRPLHSEMHSFYASGTHAYANEYRPRFWSSRACALPFLHPPPWHLPCHAFSTVTKEQILEFGNKWIWNFNSFQISTEKCFPWLSNWSTGLNDP